MLLTDGNPNNTADLQVYETMILSVANIEGIDLDAKLGLATEEISEDVLDILLDHTRSVDPESTLRRMIGVSDVVVSPQMKRWHALHTLAVVYRDAFNNQLNDRYQAKWNEYKILSQNAKLHTIHVGIGLSLAPIPEAETPEFSTTDSAGSADTIYYVAVTWVSAMGAEGAPSPVTTFEAPAGTAMVVTAVNPPEIATGFNVYAGLTATSLTLQNSPAVAVGESFTLPAGTLAAGTPVGDGQTADTYIVGGPTLRRG
jgi:hypothetical protein